MHVDLYIMSNFHKFRSFLMTDSFYIKPDLMIVCQCKLRYPTLIEPGQAE